MAKKKTPAERKRQKEKFSYSDGQIEILHRPTKEEQEEMKRIVAEQERER